jgi:hypothetical protein
MGDITEALLELRDAVNACWLHREGALSCLARLDLMAEELSKVER